MMGVSDVEAGKVGTDIVAEVPRYKSGCNSGTVSQINLRLVQHLPDSVNYTVDAMAVVSRSQ